MAQPSARFLLPPPPLNPLPGKTLRGVTEDKKGLNMKSQEGGRVGREIRYNLGIDEVPGTIYNPSTGTEDRVRLRSYVDLGEDMKKSPDPSHKFIAPLIRMRPGQTVRLTLLNQLEPEKEGECTNHDNKPNCFNTTNLHSHGLWVSPAGNSDNVLLNIKPKASFQYEYNVPEDHPAGTFWYHPHVHGSTALQVASGMAGAIIIEGDRHPIVTPKGEVQATGDIDVLLAKFAPRELQKSKAAGKTQNQQTEMTYDYPDVLLFQQIPYACFKNKADNTGEEIVVDKNLGRWACGKEQVGVVKDFTQQLGFTKWAASGRYTSINGIIHPTIPMKTKRVYRWRMIDAGAHESIALRINKLDPSVQWPEKAKPDEEQKYVEKCKQGEVVNQFEIAADGLTRAQIEKRSETRLQPGYRSDVLFAFPSAGTYCVYDDAARATSSVGTTNEGPRMLGWVTVTGEDIPGTQETFIQNELKTAAREVFTDRAVRAKIIADLDNGLRTTAFAAHKPVSSDELIEKIEKVELSANGKSFMIDKKPFNASNTPRQLVLGTAQKWELTTAADNLGNHPFHIHVNPFQIVKITQDKNGVEEEINYASDEDYAGMLNTWKDTILVKHGYKVTLATRYERYIGDFVLHCHILDHEDQGMMQYVSIVPSDSNGEAMPAGHNGPGHAGHGKAGLSHTSP